MAQPDLYSLWKMRKWHLTLFDTIFALLFDTYATLYSKSYIEKTESEISFIIQKISTVFKLKIGYKIIWTLFYEGLVCGEPRYSTSGN